MINAFFLLLLIVISLFIVIKSAGFAISQSTQLAKSLKLPKYIIGFLVVALISILPETFISITSAIQNAPSLGLGTLFGSNVADLTLVFALVVIVAGRELKIESKIIKNRFLYICMILIPLIFGANGYYSQIEGITLIIIGVLFYIFILRESHTNTEEHNTKFSANNMLFLILSMAGLLLGSHLTVKYSIDLAELMQINPAVIGMFIIGTGTILPELFFSIKATKENHDSLALGDILGTVIADATIVVGIIATINPFFFNPRIVYITGIFMLISIIILLYMMKTKRTLSKREVFILLFIYSMFIVFELVVFAQ